ncbi:hypothetical protein VCR17J2_700104 [Vibrio coralliirubri]|nr:hypothetical protein VCR17J2_700104 [Vibrio coralliirubri]
MLGVSHFRVQANTKQLDLTSNWLGARSGEPLDYASYQSHASY